MLFPIPTPTLHTTPRTPKTFAYSLHRGYPTLALLAYYSPYSTCQSCPSLSVLQRFQRLAAPRWAMSFLRRKHTHARLPPSDRASAPRTVKFTVLDYLVNTSLRKICVNFGRRTAQRPLRPWRSCAPRQLLIATSHCAWQAGLAGHIIIWPRPILYSDSCGGVA